MYYPVSLNLATFGINSSFISGLVSTWGYNIFIGVPNDYIDDFIATSQGLLIEQFEESESIRKFVSIFVRPLQETELVASQLLKCRNLDNATGDRLDIAGEIVGVERGSLNDNDYRNIIKLYIMLNRSCGEPEILITALKSFTKASAVHYFESYPAKVIIEFISPFTPDPNLETMLQKLAVGGVKIMLSWAIDDDPNFSFSGEGVFPPPSKTSGLGEEFMAIDGGKFIEKYI